MFPKIPSKLSLTFPQMSSKFYQIPPLPLLKYLNFSQNSPKSPVNWPLPGLESSPGGRIPGGTVLATFVGLTICFCVCRLGNFDDFRIKLDDFWPESFEID